MTTILSLRSASNVMRTILVHGFKVVHRPQPIVRLVSSSRPTLSSVPVEVKEASRSLAESDNLPGRQSMSPMQIMNRLERIFNRFEASCHNLEQVDQRNYLRTFETFTGTVQTLEELNQISPEIKSSLAVLAAVLLRCCGSLMNNVVPKEREVLACSLWEFLKAKQIPLDISHYNSLIRVFNENHTEYDPQIIMKEIESSGLHPDRVTYQRLIHRYCILGDITSAMKLLETMKELNMDLNEMIFASLITGYCQQPSSPSIEDIFELMRSNNIDPGSKSFSAAIKAQVINLSKDPQNTTDLQKIYDLMVQEDVNFDNSDIIELSATLNPIKSNEIVAKILDFLRGSGNFRNIRDQYKLIAALLQVGDYREASRVYWSNKPSEASIRRKNVGINYIKLLVHHPSVPRDFCLEECTKMRDSGHNDLSLMLLFYFSASCGNLEMVRAVLSKLEGEQGELGVHLYWPLLAQSKDDGEVIRVLKDKFCNLKNKQDLLETLTLWVWPKYFENMKKMFQINKEELHFPNDLLVTSLINYAIQNDSLGKAIQFLIESPPESLANNQDSASIDEELEEDQREDAEFDGGHGNPMSATRARNRSVARLLNQILEQTKDPDIIRKTYELFKSGQRFSSGALNAMVKVHLLQNDFNKAFEVFVELSREHGITPCKRELMIHCLENKDPEGLQKIMDISTEIHGEMNSLFDLAVSCLECGKLKQATKIFNSPGFRVRTSRVYDACRQLTKTNDLKVAEEFVHLCRDLYEVEPERLYGILLSAYDRTSNASRALHLWNRMQEEDFHPSKRSLVMIANLLEKNGIPVPFQRPLSNR